jgi:hypothetical protein
MSTPNPTREDRERLKARLKTRIRIRSLVKKLERMTQAERARFTEGFMSGLRARKASAARKEASSCPA